MIVLGFAIGLFVLVAVWDYSSGQGEVWVHYVNPDNPSVLGKYHSHEECAKQIQLGNGSGGCRRVDGPYGAMNAIADKLL